ncbi:hypothetical protein PILCRDRAFT_820517 [Piloderma croceum F 1598]|uniref:Uncharacterized protein n=1 Tax=Piloderma croceum (strain F 1598) TaxID=765440 RepID=A0A0C3FR19_PILCF|nr:hypothetical protein PILCRDRAFT_820517 [Piloderma croceum F 1598]
MFRGRCAAIRWCSAHHYCLCLVPHACLCWKYKILNPLGTSSSSQATRIVEAPGTKL